MSCHRAAVLAAASLLLAGLVSPLAAGTPHSWLIDPAKFHISAHGQLPCATCHESVASSAAHPDPRNVNQPPARPDPAAGCLQCHEPVQAALAQGRHGRMTERQAAKFRDCVSCHNPHTAIKVADRISKHITAFKRPQDECGACHAARQKLPKLAADDARCMSCHEGGAVSRQRDAALCLHCHGDVKKEAQVHAGVSCTICHPAAAAYGHAHQPGGDCSQCHAPHYAEARDPHVNVDCRACHVRGGRTAAQTHNMVRHPARQDCARCHFDGNQVGASALVLPAKSVLCMGCHASTLSVGDVVTIPSLLVFLLGLAVAMSLWLSGAGGFGGGLETLLSPRTLLVALQSLLVDSVFQWRLLRQSVVRWAIHLLIFLPLAIRCAWGAAILALSWTGARGTWFVALLDKNHPVNALLLDGTGVLIVVGVCAAIARGIATRRQRLPGLPGQDHAALGLIGGVVVVGFVLEGMRIAMTGASGGWAFLGYAISRAFTAGPALARSYGYVWYLHAALTGAFVAYLPFSRMFHILVAPVVLAGRAVRHSGHAAHGAGD